MPNVRFTSHLRQFFNDLEETSIDGATVAEVLANLERRHPGIGDYLRDETGALRKHVNVFVGTELVNDRAALSDAVDSDAEIYIMQALSGG